MTNTLVARSLHLTEPTDNRTTALCAAAAVAIRADVAAAKRAAASWSPRPCPEEFQ